MSGNSSNHYVDAVNTLTNGKEKWIPGKATDGAVHTYITNDVCETKSTLIIHVPAGTTPTGSLEATIPIHSLGYSIGTINIIIDDVTPAGDLGGTFDIAYSMDGVNFDPYETLATVANIGVDDSQSLRVEFSDLTAGADAAGFTHVVKNIPYFKIRESMTGTLAAVTFKVEVFMEK